MSWRNSASRRANGYCTFVALAGSYASDLVIVPFKIHRTRTLLWTCLTVITQFSFYSIQLFELQMLSHSADHDDPNLKPGEDIVASRSRTPSVPPLHTPPYPHRITTVSSPHHHRTLTVPSQVARSPRQPAPSFSSASAACCCTRCRECWETSSWEPSRRSQVN